MTVRGSEQQTGAWWLVATVAVGFVALASPKGSALELAAGVAWAACLVLWAKGEW